MLRDGDKCFYADEEAIGPLWKGLRFPMEACVSGWAMRHKAPALIEHIYTDPRVPIEAYEPTFVRSLVMVPDSSPRAHRGDRDLLGQAPCGPGVPGQVAPEPGRQHVDRVENVSILQDLDQRIRARTVELEAANVDLAAFNAAVSHDLRNPINAIMGFATLIAQREQASLSPKSVEWLERIRGASQRMAALIEDLLRLSAASDGALTPTRVDLSAVADAVFEGLRQAEPGREVEIQVEQGLELVGDAGLWQIVLANLLGNAWKYTARTFGARIDVGRADRSGTRVLRARQRRGIRHGTGRPAVPAILPAVVGPGIQGNGHWPGDGQAHRRPAWGRIWAESSPGRGASFFVALP